ncbi:MAG: beta-lactamase family protein, partial [Chloroflexi bacterium]|nr:beta-lactamase family protein [Chloroflexota bacterium]
MAETAVASTSVEETFRLFGEEIQQQMDRLHVPGVVVGILCDGKEYAAGFGVTNVEHPLPVGADTLFQIGSTTKTFTGTAIMRLVEGGKIDLDATVRTYLPDLILADEDVAARVTVRHLVTHMGGWLGDFFADEGRGDDALARIVARMAEVEQLTPLGELWSYSNSSFYLLGRIIEVMTGKTFEHACQELVLDPLGMRMSFFFAQDVMPHKFAVGHRVVDDKPQVAHPWALPRTANAAGGIISTVRDQLAYARFHLGDGTAGDGTRLLSKKSMALMQSPLARAGSFAEHVGVTWYIRNVDGAKVVQHGGTTNGQLSAFMLVPERGFAVTVLTNADKGGELHGEATRWAFKHFLGLNDAVPSAIEASEEQLAPYLGSYSGKAMDVTVTLDEGKLLLTPTAKPSPLIAATARKTGAPPAPPSIPPFHAALSGEDRAVALDPPYKNALLEFIRDGQGEIAWLRVGGRLLKRTEPEGPSEAQLLFDRLCQRVEELRETLKVPGLAVGITFEGKEFVRAFGVTNIDHPLPVDESTLFQIGSTTKTVTGTVAMRLVEMGKLDLDAPVRTYLPDLTLKDESVAARVTMRHLLTHTGGWVGDYFDDTGSGDDALQTMMERIAGLDQLTPLGEVWSYNNSGF